MGAQQGGYNCDANVVQPGDTLELELSLATALPKRERGSYYLVFYYLYREAEGGPFLQGMVFCPFTIE